MFCRVDIGRNAALLKQRLLHLEFFSLDHLSLKGSLFLLQEGSSHLSSPEPVLLLRGFVGLLWEEGEAIEIGTSYLLRTIDHWSALQKSLEKHPKTDLCSKVLTICAYLLNFYSTLSHM